MSNSDEIRNVIIIGSGPAGLTAALYTARAFLKPLIIEGAHPGGQLMGTTAVENWPSQKSILGPQLMMNMKEHAAHFGAEFKSATITEVFLDAKPFQITTNKNETLLTHTLIIATGASPNMLQCPGEQEYWGKGVTTCAVCDGAFYPQKKVVIVGGGDTAMEDASFMAKVTDDVTIIHILDKLTASPSMQKRVLDDPKIKIIYNSTITEIRGNGSVVTDVTLIDQKTKTISHLSTDVVFLAIGQKPNSRLFQGKVECNHMGYIKPILGTQTSIPGVFVAGDVADYRYRQAITSSGTGCMAALDAQRYLEKTR